MVERGWWCNDVCEATFVHRQLKRRQDSSSCELVSLNERIEIPFLGETPMVRKIFEGFLVTGLGLGALSVPAEAAPTLARRDVSRSTSVAQRKTEAKLPASRLVKPQRVAQERELPPLENPPEDAVLRQPPPREILPEETAPQERTPQETLPRQSSPSEFLPGEALPGEELTAEPIVPPQPSDAQATTEQGVFRLEPPNKLIPVPPSELKPGVVYLHDSPRLGRQVWSFLQADGQFWHAFGPGTTMAIEQFDLRMTDEDAKEALKKIDPKLAFEVTSSVGIKVFLRLESDNTWKLVRTKSVASIYDIETDQRWEKQWDRYLPVVHICGDTWQYRDGGYQAPQWGSWMRPN